jgi:hypothetical protein
MSTTAEPVIQHLETKALSLPNQARSIRIADQAGYEKGAEVLKGFVALRKEIEAHYGPLKAAAFESHRKITAAEKMMLEPVTEAEVILKREVARYVAEEARKRIEAERLARAEAERLAQEEALLNAIEAQQQGATEAEQQAILDVRPPVMVPKVAPAFQPVRGVSTSQTWSAQCFDIRALCRAVADGTASPELVLPNMPVLNKLAVALKATFAVPGCRSVPTDGVRVGGR